MSEVKKLAGQTMWYGMSAVAAKLINALLTPLLTYFMVNPEAQMQYGSISLIYSYFALMNVLFTYGMETAYFRFCANDKTRTASIFNTAFGSLLISSIIFCIALYLFKVPIASFLVLDSHVEYITIAIFILFFDTIQTVPFARLRQENKPKKYAAIRVGGIIVNIAIVVFVLAIMPKLVEANPNGFWASIHHQFDTVSLVLIANLLQSIFTFIALQKEWRVFKFSFDKALWAQMFKYSSPMILIGLAGIANEVIDRQMLVSLVPGGEQRARIIQAIYAANYKLSIVVTMFITAFRMAAEPFFFSKAKDKNAPALYAQVMNWFVMTVCFAFLVTALFLEDVWSLYISAPYRTGLYIVPVLLLANVFSGIYFNLSTWYKVSNKMYAGVIITFIGAIITFLGNYLFIPKYEMWAAAGTTLACYFAMVVMCYWWGKKHFPVPYRVDRIVIYIGSIIVLFVIQYAFNERFSDSSQVFARLSVACGLLIVFLILVFGLERKALAKMPIIGKFIK